MLTENDLLDYVLFPDPMQNADEDGIVAIEGELSPEFLISAYRQGIFPWFNPEEPILWWSPDPRCILELGEMKITKSFRQWLKNRSLTIKMDTCFEQVLINCKTINRKDEQGTWISTDIEHSYLLLHNLGIGHSVEVFNEKNELIGGLYGLSMGKAFYGESMFSRESNTSKLALCFLQNFLAQHHFHFIDCQVPNPHLLSLGCKEITRETFLERNKNALEHTSLLGTWTNLAEKFGKDFEI